MTTVAVLSPPPSIIRPALPVSGQSATLAIPLAEFGKSLADADLDRWFEDFAERNSDSGHTYAISGKGVLLIMPPTGHPGVLHELAFVGELYIWNKEHGGYVFPPTARFTLPDGSRLGPDAAWLRAERRADLMRPDSRPFPGIIPDFIAEIQSPSNSRAELVAKINLFIAYGTRLAWLMDAETREVVKFRPGQEPELLYDPEFVDGDADVLPGFRFAVREKIFDFMTAAGASQ